MSIYRSEEFQAMEAANRPNRRPDANPVNRTAIYWLISVTDDRRLSSDARRLATFLGTEAVAGRSHSTGVGFLLTSGTGLRRTAASQALGELARAGLIEIDAGQILLVVREVE